MFEREVFAKGGGLTMGYYTLQNNNKHKNIYISKSDFGIAVIIVIFVIFIFKVL
jgi:hypothetical protein